MKKFFKNLLICLIILIVFGAVVFFLGWTQIKVSPNSIGILKSKTSGVLNEPVYPGKFSWHWEFLLPTNVDFQTYELKPYSETAVISGMLPSGDVYSSFSEGHINFNYSFNFDFTVSVKPESIVALVTNVSVSNQETLEKYLNDSCKEAAKKITSEIISKAEHEPSYYPLTLSNDDIKDLLDLKAAFPYVEFNSITLSSAVFPDVSLYNKAREKYLSQFENFTDTKSQKDEDKNESQESDFLGKLRQLLNAEQE